MEESLKIISLVHQILIGVSAAIVAFALSPSPARQYREALSAISLVQELNLADYETYALPLIGRIVVRVERNEA